MPIEPRDMQLDRARDVVHRQLAGDGDQPCAVEREARRVETHHRIVHGIEHILAAQKGIARSPAGIDRRSVDDEIDAASVRFGIEHDRAARATEVSALHRQPHMPDGELRAGEIGIDPVDRYGFRRFPRFGRTDSRRQYRNGEQQRADRAARRSGRARRAAHSLRPAGNGYSL
jgi:hypothetical protein